MDHLFFLRGLIWFGITETLTFKEDWCIMVHDFCFNTFRLTKGSQALFFATEERADLSCQHQALRWTHGARKKAAAIASLTQSVGNLSSYNERPQRTMTNRQLIFDEQQLHRLQVPHNWCLVICTFKERTHPNITPSHEKQRPDKKNNICGRWEGSCVNPKDGEKFPPFTSTFCSKSLSGCIKKHLI